MKSYIFLLVISVLALTSCSKEEMTLSVEEKSGISLDVVCSKLSPSSKTGISGTKPGEDEYDENIIKTIDYYFYPYGKTDEAAVLHDRVSPNKLNQATENVSVDEAMLNTVLFPRPEDRCIVAVLVNYPSTTHPAAAPLVDIQNLPLVLQLSGGKGTNQSEFVMFGVDTVKLLSRKATLVADPVVDVHRIAAKITLDAHIADSTIVDVNYVDGDTYVLKQIWRPNIAEMFIYLENGYSKAKVSGDPNAYKPYQEADFFKYPQLAFKDQMVSHTIRIPIYSEGDPSNGVEPSQTGYRDTTMDYHVSPPFYTYPQTWGTADPKEPFLKLVLPWTRDAGNDKAYNDDYATKPHSWGSIKKQFYYRILLPSEATGLVSNNWYHINLDVEILGAETDGASVDIEGQYYVVDWNQGTTTGADIKGGRYLSVSQTSHTMYNTESLSIPYVTSNTCEIVEVVLKQYDFKTRTWKTSPTDFPRADTCITLDNNNNIVIKHALNNDITKNNFDVAPYELTFTIRHKDKPSYNESISIVQYPAMFIVEEKSNGYTYVKGVDNVSETKDNYNRRAIWDGSGIGNGNAPGNPNSRNWRYYYNSTTMNRFMGSMTTRDLVNGSGDNNNQYQYTIHVTVLPEGSTSSIGDPRGEATTLSGLPDCTGYKPAAENTEDIIAPVFKIASSYGKTSYLTYEGAQKRCAAYQENGYPAGRWRLPTKAEIEYLVTLSAKDKIPTLFGNGTAGYWAAGGEFFVADELSFHKASDFTPTVEDANFIDGGQLYVTYYGNYHVVSRCVYDVWYWGDKKVTTADEWAGYVTNKTN